MKVCSKCNLEKDESCFKRDKSKEDGLYSSCKECVTKYRKENADKIKIYKKNYRELNKDKINAHKRNKWKTQDNTKANKHNREYYYLNRNKVLEKAAKYYIENKTKINTYKKKWVKKKRKTDINFKLLLTLRHRCLMAIKNVKGYKYNNTIKLLGESITVVRQHLEKQFKYGMTWQNHGSGNDKWHIDHIIPCSSFDLTKEDEQKKCFHYTNLQPLWQYENLSKSDKILNTPA